MNFPQATRALFGFCFLACLSLTVSAQPGGAREPQENGPPPRASDKLYNFFGNWTIISSWKEGPIPKAGVIPFTPEYEAKRAELERLDSSGGVVNGRNNRCIPTGMPDLLTFGFTVFGDAEKLVMLGGYGTIRPISLTQKEHTPDDVLFGTYQGEAIASWDGDSLVIDSVGYDSTNEITYGLAVDDPNMHLVERWTLTDLNTLKIDVTIMSEKALTKPWNYSMVYTRKAHDDVEIIYCDDPLIDNAMNLTPPANRYIPPGADE